MPNAASSPQPVAPVTAERLPVSATLAEFVASLDAASLPPEVSKRTSQLVLDQFGIALRARHEAALCDATAATCARLGLTGGSARVIGDPARYAPPGAAFFNGCLGHALDFDDTHAKGSIHPSAPIVPAALAAAEMTGASGAELVAAIVAGYEVQIRLSLALGPSVHYARGFHPTATCGAFGAAAAAARLMQVDAAGIERAFGLVGSQAAGSMQFLVDGAWNKAFHVGYAAMNGLVAASLAAEGYQGATGAIEGEYGFLHGYSDGATPALAIEALGERWETLDIAVKPYPSCRYGHAAMDALIALRAEHGFTIEDIASVRIGLPATGIRLIGTPLPDKQAPENYVDGQFSMPFVGAIALRDGAMGWDAYDQHLGDADTLALCKRIDVYNDPAIEAMFPDYMAGSAEVTLADGTSHSHTVKVAKGEPANFLTDAELLAKFDALAAPVLEPASRERLGELLLDVASAPSVELALELGVPGDKTVLRAAS